MAALMTWTVSLLRSGLRYATGWRCFSEHRVSPYGVSLPPVIHNTLTEEDHLLNREIFVVGDVHGCCDELELLLDKSNALSNNACVIFVGDLVNKGPKNAEVIKLAKRISSFCVRGNHDEVCMKAWETSLKENLPLPQSFKWMQDLTGEEMTWFFNLPYTLSIPSRKLLVVHAGVVPAVSLPEQDLDDLIHMRNVFYDAEEDRWRGSNSTKQGEPWISQWAGPEHIYFGHDARRRLQRTAHATGLDTGCVYGGELTGVFPHSQQILTVPAKQTYRHPG